MFLEVARVLRRKVYVTATKLRLLECLGFSKEDMQWFTYNEQDSHIHVVPMWTLASFKRLKHISNQYAVRSINLFHLISFLNKFTCENYFSNTKSKLHFYFPIYKIHLSLQFLASKYLHAVYTDCQGRFSLIVAFSPTGWTFGKGKGKKSPGRRWQQGTIIRYTSLG